MTARTPERSSRKSEDSEAVGTALTAVQDADMELLDSLVGYNLRRAAARQRERFRSVFSPFDLRPVQLTTLTLISRNEPIRQAALGKALEMKRANVVTLLDDLQKRGLIKRTPAPDDRRSYVVELTGKGRKFTGEMLELHSRLEADLARSFGEAELRQLVDLLVRFRSVSDAPKLR